MIYVGIEAVSLMCNGGCRELNQKWAERGRPWGFNWKILEIISKRISKLKPQLGDLIMFDCGERGTVTATFVERPADSDWVPNNFILNHETGEIRSLNCVIYDEVQWLPLPVSGAITDAELLEMNGHGLNRLIRENVKRVPLR